MIVVQLRMQFDQAMMCSFQPSSSLSRQHRKGSVVSHLFAISTRWPAATSTAKPLMARSQSLSIAREQCRQVNHKHRSRYQRSEPILSGSDKPHSSILRNNRTSHSQSSARSDQISGFIGIQSGCAQFMAQGIYGQARRSLVGLLRCLDIRCSQGTINNQRTKLETVTMLSPHSCHSRTLCMCTTDVDYAPDRTILLNALNTTLQRRRPSEHKQRIKSSRHLRNKEFLKQLHEKPCWLFDSPALALYGTPEESMVESFCCCQAICRTYACLSNDQTVRLRAQYLSTQASTSRILDSTSSYGRKRFIPGWLASHLRFWYRIRRKLPDILHLYFLDTGANGLAKPTSLQKYEWTSMAEFAIL